MWAQLRVHEMGKGLVLLLADLLAELLVALSL
jgi:hypothetical protein